MAKLYPLEVHTPSRLFYTEPVEAIVLTLTDGEIAVYADHSPFIAPVQVGVLRIKAKDGQWRRAFITEGILEVTRHKTVLLVDAAEWPEEIDEARAREAKVQAEKRLQTAGFSFARESAKAALLRAECRLRLCEPAAH
jgi:F-type H+-transporting ATPase subunit epsilon